VPLRLVGALEVERRQAGELVPLHQGRLVETSAVDAALGAFQHFPVVAELELGLERGEVRLVAGIGGLLRRGRSGEKREDHDPRTPGHSATSFPERVRVAPGSRSTVERTVRYPGAVTS